MTQDEGANEAIVQRSGAIPLCRCKAPHQEDALHTHTHTQQLVTVSSLSYLATSKTVVAVMIVYLMFQLGIPPVGFWVTLVGKALD